MPTTIMRYNFKSLSYLLGMLGYPGHVVVGILGSDYVPYSWFLLGLLMFSFCHLEISGVNVQAVSGWSLFLL